MDFWHQLTDFFTYIWNLDIYVASGYSFTLINLIYLSFMVTALLFVLRKFIR